MSKDWKVWNYEEFRITEASVQEARKLELGRNYYKGAYMRQQRQLISSKLQIYKC
jgi:hypothetical protein